MRETTLGILHRKAAAVAILSLLLAGAAASLLQAAEKADPVWGTPAAPSNATAIAGRYYCGDGLGYNLTLTLSTNGIYAAEWNGCLGRYGESSGTWKLSGQRVVLTAEKETGSLIGHLQTLETLRFNDDWVFLRADHRKLYEKHGVTRFTCFQKRTT